MVAAFVPPYAAERGTFGHGPASPPWRGDVRKRGTGEHWGVRKDRRGRLDECGATGSDECGATGHGDPGRVRGGIAGAVRRGLRAAGEDCATAGDRAARGRMARPPSRRPREAARRKKAVAAERPLVVFLRETMRSIASDHWRRLHGSVVVAESEMGADGDAGGGAVVSAVDETAQPERRASAEETIARIEAALRATPRPSECWPRWRAGGRQRRFSRRSASTRHGTRARCGGYAGGCGASFLDFGR